MSTGIDRSGRIFVLGRDEFGNYGLYEVIEGQLVRSSDPVLPLPGAEGAGELVFSRGAKYLAGTSYFNEQPAAQATLWRRESLDAPIGLGFLISDGELRATTVTGIASVSKGPIVVGRGAGSFIWTEATGMQRWITNSQYPSALLIQGISANGRRLIGHENSFQNGIPTTLPFAGTLTRFKLLASPDEVPASVLGVSPNGLNLCGYVKLRSTIWSPNGRMKTLSLGTNYHYLDAITDSGMAVGYSTAGRVFYDSRGKKLELFDNWWAKHHGDVPLPGTVRRINDLYEWRGNLYFLLETRAPEDTRLSMLAIAPLKKGRKHR